MANQDGRKDDETDDEDVEDDAEDDRVACECNDSEEENETDARIKDVTR